MRTRLRSIYFNAVFAATAAGFFSALIVAVCLSLYAATQRLPSETIFSGILGLPALVLFTGGWGAAFGIAIGFAVGTTFSAAWAMIQRLFGLGFLSDLLFIIAVVSLYVSQALRAGDSVPESILPFASIIALGSVIAAVEFRRLLNLPFALRLLEART